MQTQGCAIQSLGKEIVRITGLLISVVKSHYGLFQATNSLKTSSQIPEYIVGFRKSMLVHKRSLSFGKLEAYCAL